MDGFRVFHFYYFTNNDGDMMVVKVGIRQGVVSQEKQQEAHAMLLSDIQKAAPDEGWRFATFAEMDEYDQDAGYQLPDELTPSEAAQPEANGECVD